MKKKQYTSTVREVVARSRNGRNPSAGAVSVMVSNSGGAGTDPGLYTDINSLINFAAGLQKILIPVDADYNELKWSDDDIYAVKSTKGLYSLDFVSAKGPNTDMGGGLTNLLTAWSDYDAANADDWGLSAGLGWQLHNSQLSLAARVSALETGGTGGGGMDVDALVAYLADNDYLTKAVADGRYLQPSALSGYATEQWVETKGYLTSVALTGYLSKTEAASLYQPKGDYLTGASLSGYLPLAGGTMTGDISFAGIAGDAYPIVSRGLKWGGGTDGANIFYRLAANDAGRLVLNMFDDANTEIDFEWSGGSYNGGVAKIPYRFLHNSLIATEVAAEFKSLKLGDCEITYDSVNGGLKFSTGIYSVGYVSAKGPSNIAGAGGGGNYDRLDSWGDYDNDKAEYVLSAGLGYGLYQSQLSLAARVSSLESGGGNYVTLDTAQAITGAKTFAAGAWILKASEANEIKNVYYANGTIGQGSVYPATSAIRHGIDFRWYGTHWIIGNIRGGSDNSDGFGIGLLNGESKLDLGLRVTKGAIYAQSFKKSDGTSSQFLKADGSVDSNTYATEAYTSQNYVRALYGNDALVGADMNEMLSNRSFIGSVSVDSNAPSGNGWYNVIQLAHRNGSSDGPSYVGQIALGMTVNHENMFFRTHRTRAWQRVLTSNNFSSYLDGSYVKKLGDTITGKLTVKASDWGGQLEVYRNEGNVGSAIKYTNSNETLGYVGIGGSGSTFPYDLIFENKSGVNNKIWHSGNDGSGSGLDADLLDGYHRNNLFLGTHEWLTGTANLRQAIEVGGDANTYYPVIITVSDSKDLPTKISIWKNLNSKTPAYPGNHANGTSSMWLVYEGRKTWWDGNNGFMRLQYRSMFYATLCAKAEANNTVHGGLIVWLRGGGCEYRVSCTNQFTVTVALSEYTLGTSGSNVYKVAPTTTLGNLGVIGDGYALYGIATSATKLANTRTIWGQNFNGEGNVDGTLTIQQAINTHTAYLRLLESSNYQGGYITYNGVSNILHIGVHEANDSLTSSDNNVISIIRSNGNVGIGTASPVYKLDVAGSIRGNTIHGIAIELSYTSPFIDFHFGSSDADYTSRIIENASGELAIVGKLKIGTSSNSYALNAASFICDSWVRTKGATGWYNETYGGGWYMTEQGWVRTYNQKSVYTGLGQIRSDNSFTREGYVGSSWGAGKGAYNVAITNDAHQTPLLMAYRAGADVSATGANRLYSMELLNSGEILRHYMGGNRVMTLTNAMRVGINCDPGYTLDVSGDARVTGMLRGGSLSLNGGSNPITWDAANNAYRIEGNVYSTGGMAAKGPNFTSDVDVAVRNMTMSGCLNLGSNAGYKIRFGLSQSDYYIRRSGNDLLIGQDENNGYVTFVSDIAFGADQSYMIVNTGDAWLNDISANSISINSAKITRSGNEIYVQIGTTKYKLTKTVV